MADFDLAIARATWTLDAADATAVRRVRDKCIDELQRYGNVRGDYAACSVVFTELVSNAARHASNTDPVDIELSWSDVRPTLRVHDRGAGFVPRIALPPPDAESGRGLYLVAHLAEFPSVVCDAAGCTVGVALPVRRRRSAT